MSATLELTDGATTLDLLGPPYRASQPVRIEPPGARAVLAGQALRGVHYSPRIVETDLNLKAADVTSLRSAIRALESLCSVSESRQSIAHGAPVSLRCQLGGSDAPNTDQGAEYRVLRGELVLPPTLLQEPALSTAHAVTGARLRLLVEPFGRLAQVALPELTVHNEQDGAANNWLDVTGGQGTHGAKLRLKIGDPGGWSGPSRMWVARRSGGAQGGRAVLPGRGRHDGVRPYTVRRQSLHVGRRQRRRPKRQRLRRERRPHEVVHPHEHVRSRVVSDSRRIC